MRKLSQISKKGQVQTIAPNVLALLFAAVVLVFGLIIIQSVRDTDVVRQANSFSLSNQTQTVLNETGFQLDSGMAGQNNFAVSAVYNQSNGTHTLTIANYSVSSTGILSYTGSGADAYNGSIVNVSYSVSHGDEAYAQANLTITGLGTFADFWEIIVLAIVISVVIGLLLITFAGRRER